MRLLLEYEKLISILKGSNNFPFCLSVAAIILVAVIYYYSQPIGTTTWIRALLYPSWLQYSIGFVLNLHYGIPKIWSISSLTWWFFRYCAVAPTILAGQIDPILFEALYVSSFFFSWLRTVLEHILFEFVSVSVFFFPVIVFIGLLNLHKHMQFCHLSIFWVLRLSMYEVFLMWKDMLQASHHAIFLFAKIPQIWRNFSVS